MRCVFSFQRNAFQVWTFLCDVLAFNLEIWRMINWSCQINVGCSDRNFAYKLTDEMHDTWIKKLFLVFARTSEFNGPRETDVPNPMIQQEMDEVTKPSRGTTDALTIGEGTSKAVL